MQLPQQKQKRLTDELTSFRCNADVRRKTLLNMDAGTYQALALSPHTGFEHFLHGIRCSHKYSTFCGFTPDHPGGKRRCHSGITVSPDGLKFKASLLEEQFSIPVQMATAGKDFPEGIYHVLKSPHPDIRRTNMFEKQKFSSRF
jgi:hypothetical protein